MTDGKRDDPSVLRDLVAQKEKEWKDVTELRIDSLESACKEKERQLKEEKEKIFKLKEDFKYNLKLLEERDQELERYDASFSELKAKLNAKTAEISEHKIKIDELKSMRKREEQSNEELQIHYNQRLKEKQKEIDSYRWSKDEELQEERKEFESFKRNLQRQLKHVEEELDAQKRELTVGFEESMKRKEHEFRVKSDEMSSQVLAYEIKAKMLSKELEIIKSAQEKTAEEVDQVENNHRELEKKLKQKDWELHNERAMNNAKVKELETKVKHLQSSSDRMHEDFNRKYADMDKIVREKEIIVANLKEAYSNQEQKMKNKNADLNSMVEDYKIKIKQLEWSNKDLIKERDLKVESLQMELRELREKSDDYLSSISKDTVSRDVEMQTLKGQEEQLRLELRQRKDDIARYKRDLSLSTEREASLERSKAQVDLDWQRKYEECENKQFEKSEDLIKKLSRSRDDALATVKEKDRELKQQEMLISALQRDRDQAFATLKKNGISLDKNINVPSLSTNRTEVEHFKEQNENLKLVISEMRKQIENMGDTDKEDLLSKHASGTSVTEEYITNLEKEVRELKHKNRRLEEENVSNKTIGLKQTSEVDSVMSQVKDNVMVKSHLQSLNDMIGALRSEKIELSAEVKKQQTRIVYLQNALDRLNKQPREKQAEVEQLQYELGANNRRYQAEIASQKQRLSELEIQLAETRQEADEYHKGNTEKNLEITSLRDEISNLKLELSQKRPGINYGAQELVIQQLQDEIYRLKHKSADIGSVDISSDSAGGRGLTTNATIQELQKKLKSAAKHIAQLSKEKQQLIEMGNRLRAELKKNENSCTVPIRDQPVRDMSNGVLDAMVNRNQPISDNFVDKLGELEKLQYDLTKQQLQYAQRFQMPSNQDDLSYTEDYQPPSILKKSNHHAEFTKSKSYDSLRDSVPKSILLNQSGDGPLPGADLVLSMSSVGGESLQEIWKMLDERPSPTPRTPKQGRFHGADRSPVHQSAETKSTDEWYIKGKNVGVANRPKSEQKNSKFIVKQRPKSPRKPKIRNYNVRDDTGVR